MSQFPATFGGRFARSGHAHPDKLASTGGLLDLPIGACLARRWAVNADAGRGRGCRLGEVG